ncbi:hypothetical protein BGP75_07260 [Motiliproteus sp. MSK22-1]|nr:hypothetical protein BGP75_07260 [Motiliproteus sp. MSK22-1]
MPPGDLWVFAYGSLMWNPGFEYLEHRSARLFGYHRSLCVWSYVHRGTVKKPGMVLGLDRGGSCCGHAFRIASKDISTVTEYLYAREMPTTIYQAKLLPIHFGKPGSSAQALSFIVNRDHEQYAKKISPQYAAKQIQHAKGISGSSQEYLSNTLEHLKQLGITDHRLQNIADQLKQLAN